MDSGVTSSSGVAGNGVVKLNVGGTSFTTTLTVLTSEPDSMLGAMFSGRHATRGEKLEDGSIVINRPARLFHHVLAWLRDRTLPKQLSEEERQLLLIEANYYCLQGLVWRLKLPHFTKPLRDIRCLRELTESDTETVASIVPFLGSGGQVCLASASSDQTVKVWNTLTGELYHTLAGGTSCITTLVVFTSAEDRPCLASASYDRTIKIWNPYNGELLRTLASHTGYVYSLAVFTDAKKQICLASGSQDKTIKLWDTSTGELLRTFAEHTGPVRYLVAFIGADGCLCLASSGRDNSVNIWDSSTGDLIRTLWGNHSNVSDLVVFTSAAGQLCLASVSHALTITTWNLATSDPPRVFGGFADDVYALSSTFIDVEKQVCIASVSSDATIKMWNVSTGELLNTVYMDKSDSLASWVHCITVFTDLQGIAYLASASYHKIRIWG